MRHHGHEEDDGAGEPADEQYRGRHVVGHVEQAEEGCHEDDDPGHPGHGKRLQRHRVEASNGFGHLGISFKRAVVTESIIILYYTLFVNMIRNIDSC